MLGRSGYYPDCLCGERGGGDPRESTQSTLHRADCVQWVKLWSCPDWPGQWSCALRARHRAHSALSALHVWRGWGRGGGWSTGERGNKVQAAAQSTRELLRAKHGLERWARMAQSVQTILNTAALYCAGSAVSDWFLIMGVNQSSNEHSLRLMIYLWQSFPCRPLSAQRLLCTSSLKTKQTIFIILFQPQTALLV